MTIRSLVSISVALATSLITSLPALALPLSPGDRIRITIPGDATLPETYRFSGLYEVNLDGTLQVPLLQPLPVAGKEIAQVEQDLSSALVAGGFFRPQFLQASIQVVDWGPIQVTISGAAFEPGRVLIRDRLPGTSAVENQGQGEPQRQQPVTVSGEYPEGRYLTAAIRSAGGLKPTADIEQIRLIRNGQERVIDLSGVLTGNVVDDVALIAGDQVVIPELDTIQSDLVRPSQITPTAIAVFVSNQTSPGGGGGDFNRFEYGSRFSQAVVSARCAGGSRSVNANRRVTLIQTSRLTGQTEVHDRQAEELLRNAADETINPFLMPGDSVVCYDSRVTNASGVLNFIGNILNPVRLLRSIFFE